MKEHALELQNMFFMKSQIVKHRINQPGSLADFAFTSISTKKYSEIATDGDSTANHVLEAASGEAGVNTKFYAIPSNFLNVVDDYFYLPEDMQSVSGVGDLSDGKVDAVSLLFSD